MPSEDILVFLRAQTKEFHAKMQDAAGETEKFESRSKQAFNKMAGIGKGALLGIAGAAIAVGAKSLQAADEFEKSHARLETALENTGTSFKAQKKAIDAVEKSGEGLGFTNAQVEESLAVMTRGLGSSSKAIGYLGVAQDLAAAKGIGLADAALIVTRASEGQLRPLKQLGIDLPVAAGGALKTKNAFAALVAAQNKFNVVQGAIHAHLLKGPAALKAYAAAQDKVHAAQLKLNSVAHSGEQIISSLGKTLDGSAARQADTFAGKMAALRAKGEDLFKAIGLRLIPIIEKLAGAALNVVHWLEKHETVAKALAVAVGGVLLVAIAAYTISMITAAAATIAATWPILAVIAAIAALAVGVMFLAKHWSEIWDAITHATAAAWDWLKEFFTSLPGKIIDALASFGGKLLGWATTAFQTLLGALPKIVAGIVGFMILWPFILVAGLVKLGMLLIDKFGAAFLHLLGQLPGLALQVYVWWQLLPLHIAEKLLPLGLMLIGKMRDAFVALVKALPGAVVALGTWFWNLPGWLIGKMGDVAGAFFGVGRNIFTGVLNGIKSLAGSAREAFHHIFAGVPGADLLSHVPGVGFFFEQGGWVPGKGPRLAVVHGGEYVASQAELAGRPRSDSPLRIGGRSGSNTSFPAVAGGGVAMYVTINNPTGNGNEIAAQFIKAVQQGAGPELKRVLVRAGII